MKCFKAIIIMFLVITFGYTSCKSSAKNKKENQGSQLNNAGFYRVVGRMVTFLSIDVWANFVGKSTDDFLRILKNSDGLSRYFFKIDDLMHNPSYLSDKFFGPFRSNNFTTIMEFENTLQTAMGHITFPPSRNSPASRAFERFSLFETGAGSLKTIRNSIKNLVFGDSTDTMSPLGRDFFDNFLPEYASSNRNHDEFFSLVAIYFREKGLSALDSMELAQLANLSLEAKKLRLTVTSGRALNFSGLIDSNRLFLDMGIFGRLNRSLKESMQDLIERNARITWGVADDFPMPDTSASYKNFFESLTFTTNDIKLGWLDFLLKCERSAIDCAGEAYFLAVKQTKELSDLPRFLDRIGSLDDIFIKIDSMNSGLFSKLEVHEYAQLIEYFKPNFRYTNETVERIIKKIDIDIENVAAINLLEQKIDALSLENFANWKRWLRHGGDASNKAYRRMVENFIHGVEGVPTGAASTSPHIPVPSGLQAP